MPRVKRHTRISTAVASARCDTLTVTVFFSLRSVPSPPASAAPSAAFSHTSPPTRPPAARSTPQLRERRAYAMGVGPGRRGRHAAAPARAVPCSTLLRSPKMLLYAMRWHTVTVPAPASRSMTASGVPTMFESPTTTTFLRCTRRGFRGAHLRGHAAHGAPGKRMWPSDAHRRIRKRGHLVQAARTLTSTS